VERTEAPKRFGAALDEEGTVEDVELEQEFSGLGMRTLLINVHRINLTARIRSLLQWRISPSQTGGAHTDR